MVAETGLLLLAVLAQGMLVLILAWVMFQRRIRPLEAGDLQFRDIAISKDAWPDAAKLASNAYDNQFQLPLLFYAAVGLALYLGVNWFDVALALAFVASRYMHAFVHVTHNHVRTRFTYFVIGFSLLCAWWLFFLVRVVIAMLGVAI